MLHDLMRYDKMITLKLVLCHAVTSDVMCHSDQNQPHVHVTKAKSILKFYSAPIQNSRKLWGSVVNLKKIMC